MRALWFGVLAGPMAWSLQFQASYALTPYVCESHLVILLYGVSVAALGFCTLGSLTAYRVWVKAGREHHAAGPGVVGRSRLMALAGLGSSAFFLLVILAQALPIVLIDPCMQ